MKGIPGWLTYTVLRLLFIAVPLVIFMLVLPGQYWPFFSVAAVLIGLCLSFILLRGPRSELAGMLAATRRRERREDRPTVDDEAEDEAIDEAERSPRDRR